MLFLTNQLFPGGRPHSFPAATTTNPRKPLVTQPHDKAWGTHRPYTEETAFQIDQGARGCCCWLGAAPPGSPEQSTEMKQAEYTVPMYGGQYTAAPASEEGIR